MDNYACVRVCAKLNLLISDYFMKIYNKVLEEEAEKINQKKREKV